MFLFLRVSCPLQHRVEDSEVISTSTERRSSRREICDRVQSSHCSRVYPRSTSAGGENGDGDDCSSTIFEVSTTSVV